MSTPRAALPRPSPGDRWREFVREAGVPRLIILGFLLLLFLIAALTGMNLASLLSQSIDRVARNGILVLALLPAIQGGLGLNFGLPLGSGMEVIRVRYNHGGARLIR